MAKKRTKKIQPPKRARIHRGENPVTVEKLIERSLLRYPRFRAAIAGRTARGHKPIRFFAEIKDGQIVVSTARKSGPNPGIVWPIRSTRGHQIVVHLSDSTYQEIISSGQTTFQVSINSEAIRGRESANSISDNGTIK